MEKKTTEKVWGKQWAKNYPNYIKKAPTHREPFKPKQDKHAGGKRNYTQAYCQTSKNIKREKELNRKEGKDTLYSRNTDNNYS